MSSKSRNLLEKLIIEPFAIRNIHSNLNNYDEGKQLNSEIHKKNQAKFVNHTGILLSKNRSITIRSAPRVRSYQQDKISMAVSKKFPVDFFLKEKISKKKLISAADPQKATGNIAKQLVTGKPNDHVLTNPSSLKRIKLDSKTLRRLIEQQIKPIQEDSQQYETPTFQSKKNGAPNQQNEDNRSIFHQQQTGDFLLDKLLVRPRCHSSKDVARKVPSDTFRVRRLL